MVTGGNSARATRELQRLKFPGSETAMASKATSKVDLVVEVPTVAQFRRLTVEQRAEFLTETVRVGKILGDAEGHVTDRKAYLTYAAEWTDHVIFPTRKTGGVEVIGGGDKSTEGFMSTKVWADKFGNTAPMATVWRTLGRALMVLRMEPTSRDYIRLRTSGAAENSTVREYILTSNGPERVSGLVELLDKFGKGELTSSRATSPASESDSGAGESSDEGASDEGATVQTVASEFGTDPVKVILAALALIESEPERVSQDEAHGLSERFEGAMASVSAYHAERMAKAASRKAATRKAASNRSARKAADSKAAPRKGATRKSA